MKRLDEKALARENWFMSLSYLSILIIIPLLRYQFTWHYKNAEYSHNLKQGGILLGFEIFFWMVAFVPYIGMILYIIGSLLLLYASLTGFLKTWHGERWRLPFFGSRLKTWKI